MSYHRIKKTRESMSSYYTKLNTGVGGTGDYQIVGRPYESEPNISINFAQTGAFDFVTDNISLCGSSVAPYFVYYGKDVTETSWPAAVGTNLSQYKGSGNVWTSGQLVQTATPASGSDYTGVKMCGSLGLCNGIFACTSDTNFGDPGSNDMVLEVFFRQGQAGDTAPLVGKSDGSVTPASGAGWILNPYYLNLETVRFKGAGQTLAGSQHRCSGGQWVHCLFMMDLGGASYIFINGEGSGSSITMDANMDCPTYPLAIAGQYAAANPYRHPYTIAYVAAYRAATGWLNTNYAQYSNYIMSRYKTLYSTKLGATNTTYVMLRTVPVLSCMTGDIYSTNAPAANSTYYLSTNAVANLLRFAYPVLGSGWTNSGVNAYAQILPTTGPFGAGTLASGMRTSSAVTNNVASWTASYTGLNSSIHQNCSVSFWAKDNLSNTKDVCVVFRQDNNASNDKTTWVNVNTGTVINTSSGSTAQILSTAGQWKRFGITTPIVGSGNNVTFFAAQSGYTNVTVGVGLYAMYFWGFQVVHGDNPFTDVAWNIGTSGTYSESLTYSCTNALGTCSGTIFIDGTQSNSILVNSTIITLYEATNATNSINIYTNATNVTVGKICSDVVSSYGDISDGAEHSLSLAYYYGGSIYSLDGTFAEFTAPSIVPSGIDTILVKGDISSIKTYTFATSGM